MSPFKALYGITPRQFNLPDDEEGTSVAAVGEFFTKRNILNKILKEALTHAQNRYKMYADKNRTEREFDVGDWVYLKLQPYRQSSVEVRRNLKLSYRGGRMIKRGNKAVPQMLVQWKSSGPEEATWEDAAMIDSQFPEFLP
ncbi:reverse transcriptase [Tanacetum coccineum]